MSDTVANRLLEKWTKKISNLGLSSYRKNTDKVVTILESQEKFLNIEKEKGDF